MPSDSQAIALFEAFDSSGDGYLQLAELQAALAKGGKEVSEDDCRAILNDIDADADGKISVEEFKVVFAKAPDSLPVGVKQLVGVSNLFLDSLTSGANLVTRAGSSIFGTSDDGLTIQHFNPIRDDEVSGEATKTSMAIRAKELAKTVAVNVGLGAATGVAGVIFGVGRVAAKKAASTLQQRTAKGQGITCTVTAVRVEGLHVRSSRPTPMSPFVVATLRMDKLSKSTFTKATAYTGQCSAMVNAGPTCTFPEGKHKIVLGMPPDPEAAKSAILVLTVRDEPEAFLAGGIADKLGVANLTLGTALLSLSQLVASLEESEEVECEVNLKLQRGKDYAETEGLLRVSVALKTDGALSPPTSPS